MKHTITRATLDFTDHIEISEGEYQDIKDSIKNLIESVFIEEKFDILIENYFEYEKTLLNTSLHNLLYSFNSEFLGNSRSQITRRIINFLSACRMYIDHAKHHLSQIYGKDSQILKKFIEITSLEYDSKLSYRIIEALRNYAQHRGYPIYGIILEGKRLKDDEKSELFFSTTPYLIPSEFENDEKFKRSVYDEMKGLPSDKVDLKELVREYIESLGNIHQSMRELLQKDIEVWESTFLGVIERFKRKFGEDVSIIGLVISILDGSGKFIEHINIIEDLPNRRKKFEQKNNNLINFKERIVTSTMP